MSHLAAGPLEQLKAIAYEIRETFGERGYRIDSALSIDSAFQTKGNRSGLTRSLVKDAVRKGASQVGAYCEEARGGALELRFNAGSIVQALRVQRAERLANGKLRIWANNASTWGSLNEELLVPEEHWAFAYVPSELGIDELLVAQVRGVTAGTPGHLLLGPEIYLDGGETPRREFRGDDNSVLPGFEDEQDEQGLFGSGAW